MFEKVNPSHPDKVADRIAGAMVDLAYKRQKSPKVAVEVLIGHGICHVIAETSYHFTEEEVSGIVDRIDGKHDILDLKVVPQDSILAGNQSHGIRCGDNGIFKGAPVTAEQRTLSDYAHRIYERFGTDGKYLIDGDEITICQSHAKENEISIPEGYKAKVNPLGYWAGGTDVDTGCTNRKLGSDLGDGITGGGIHGKDLSKADVSVNIYAFLQAQKLGRVVEYHCSIGDDEIDGIPYGEIVKMASDYVRKLGGFEKLAEWGLI